MARDPRPTIEAISTGDPSVCRFGLAECRGAGRGSSFRAAPARFFVFISRNVLTQPEAWLFSIVVS
jgi:hypothetical protein